MSTAINLYPSTISTTAIHAVEDKIRSYVSSVETFSGNVFCARVKLKKVEEYAYIHASEKTVIVAHFCESSEKGVNCNHNAILAAIAKDYGYEVTFTSGKSNLKKYSLFETTFASAVWTDDSERFSISNTGDEVEEKEEVIVEQTTESEKLVSTPSSKARDWKKGWSEIQDYLDSQGIDMGLQNKILDLRQAVSANVGLSPHLIEPKKPSTPYDGPMFEEAVTHILLGEHLLLIGDAGTGKDTVRLVLGQAC